VHLPLPRNCRQVSDFTLIRAIPEAAIIASPDAIQRTACFETTLLADQTFSVEYTYKNHVDYIELDPAKSASSSADFCLEEQLPHIRFTPYLKLLLEEILASGEPGSAAATNPVVKARRIYDFITTQVMYSYMREYFTIDNISEYGAVNLKGDCGVQAILFITLCRMAGIPARWQSGLYVTGLYTGPHDWAEFYVEPWGWVFADLSFGGSSWRAGEKERWNYYFGNLDVFRMPANGGILGDFAPPKTHLRIDPVDNQRGEFEYADQGLPFAALETRQELLSFRDV
jgi:transglutaminase-like putative cysteine protease